LNARCDMEIAKATSQAMNALFTFLTQLDNTVVWICKPDYSKQLYLSDGFEKIWGRPKEDMYASLAAWPETLVVEDLAFINSEFQNRSTEPNRCSTVKFRIHRPDGELRWIKSTGYTTFNQEGVPIGIIGIDENLSPEQWEKPKTIMTQPLPLLMDLSEIIQKEFKLILPLEAQGNMGRPASESSTLPKTIKVDNKVVQLTARENQCLVYLLQGRSAKETAYYLKISTRTVETYLDKLRHKTNSRTKIALIGKIQHQFA
jgi:DNA-binding CsgD family transcriptional regulator